MCMSYREKGERVCVRDRELGVRETVPVCYVCVCVQIVFDGRLADLTHTQERLWQLVIAWR